MKANPVPEKTLGNRRRTSKGKFHRFFENFRDFMDDIIHLARDWHVPFTDNTAERAIRWAKEEDKVFVCFRSKSGVDQFSAVLSFVSTATPWPIFF